MQINAYDRQNFGQVSMGWPRLPFWQGVQSDLEPFQSFPLNLRAHADGYVAQADLDGNMAAVIANYANTEYSFITPPPGTSSWGTELGDGKLKRLIRFTGSLNGLRVLEIGGGNLFLAKKIQQQFPISRYVAVDPTLKPWPDQSGVEAIRAYFPCDELEGQEFDLVIANSCLEHVPDLIGFISAMKKILASEGRIFLTFPDVSRQFEDGDLNAIVHEHLAYLDEPSARALFAKSGLSIVRWTSEEDLAACLLVATDIKHESEEGGAAAACLLEKAVRGFTIHLPNVISNLVADIEQEKKIAFYGATNGLNNLLSIVNIACNVPIIDGDRDKHGRYLPAGRSPIQWVGSSEVAQFERLYITAGSFQKAITENLTAHCGIDRGRIFGLFRQSRF
jgi:SAM-dependent methyltransferase